MSLVRVSPSTELALALAELRAHLRLAGIDEDGAHGTDPLVMGCARAAQDWVESWLGRALTPAQWRLGLDCFPAEIRVPLPPLQSVDLITYVDADGAEQTLATSAYQVAGIGDAAPARIVPAHGERWPTTRRQPEAVLITFTAGTDFVPEAIRAALLLMATDLFEHRGSIISGDGFERLQVTKAAESLLTPYRVW